MVCWFFTVFRWKGRTCAANGRTRSAVTTGSPRRTVSSAANISCPKTTKPNRASWSISSRRGLCRAFSTRPPAADRCTWRTMPSWKCPSSRPTKSRSASSQFERSCAERRPSFWALTPRQVNAWSARSLLCSAVNYLLYFKLKTYLHRGWRSRMNTFISLNCSFSLR